MKTYRTTLEPGLEATVHAYDLTVAGATLPVWTLTTHGLSAFRQREVVLTIVRRGAASDAFPEGVLGYVPALKHFASQGRIVDDGGLSGYRSPGPFGLGSFVGLAFADPETIPGVRLPDSALAGIFLTEGELSMASSCSPRRVLNQLGKAARYFPTPYWSDPSRQPVYAMQDAGKSVLAKFERTTVANAFATLRENVMDLCIPESFTRILASRTEDRVPSAILPGREPGISAALVWTPGQSEPEAIFAEGPPPTAVAATFVALIPADVAEDDIRFMEDGYVALLSTESARHLVSSLRAAAPVELRGKAQERTLRITVKRSR